MALTIAAYNLGEPKLNAAIEKAQREGGSWLDHVPPRTRRYVYENLAREEGIPNPHEFATKKAGMAPEEAVEGGAAPSAAAAASFLGFFATAALRVLCASLLAHLRQMARGGWTYRPHPYKHSLRLAVCTV